MGIKTGPDYPEEQYPMTEEDIRRRLERMKKADLITLIDDLMSYLGQDFGQIGDVLQQRGEGRDKQ